MKHMITIFCTLLFISGCSGSPDGMPDSSDNSGPPSKWFEIGHYEAITGNGVKDNTVLSEWYGEAEINRTAYLEGFAKGQDELCQPEKIADIAKANKDFPASCNSVPNAEQLKNSWQQLIER
ncbi:DUF2799 domain-containing protein [Jinshanibacter sp. LJY008]|uniref:DUF2799 domain-containing protein n=1 Tax=Limnobaculum eriocheiris TaxID=2897391 RepID=A0A9X1SJB4_9GAMM|nr:DUF2799 domain-containing protein [Limnobaculum eriocheiris]MCD1124686.1 DUF2799 domain-containing protein [Limnobaculum eriocheiris]